MSDSLKHDGGKAPMQLLSSIALHATSMVLAFGANKYKAHGWRAGIQWSRIIGAAFRHLCLFMGGEDIDAESGLPHVDHLACCVMFLQEQYRTRKDLDDRWKPEPTEWRKGE